MNRAALFVAVVFLAGCLKPAPRPEPKPGPGPEPAPPAPVVISRAAVCDELAGQVDAGRIKTTDDLVRVLQILSDAGHWSKEDAAAVDGVLPGLPSAERQLTKDDSEKLRSVK